MQKSKAGRQNISPRHVRRHVSNLLVIALFIALALVASSSVSAQVECLGVCEAQFVGCLRNEGPVLSASCLETYEACVNACLGGYAAVLG